MFAMNNIYFPRIRYQVNFGLLKTINLLYTTSYIIKAPGTWTSYELPDTHVLFGYNIIMLLWPCKSVAISDGKISGVQLSITQ